MASIIRNAVIFFIFFSLFVFLCLLRKEEYDIPYPEPTDRSTRAFSNPVCWNYGTEQIYWLLRFFQLIHKKIFLFIRFLVLDTNK